MPPSPINPAAAALVHTLVPITPGVMDILKPEDYLLIHSCRDSGTRQIRRMTNINGECFARIDYDPVLRHSIEAELLSPYGLGDWHPGANIAGTIALGGIPLIPFANADDCFGFRGGQLIYENPVRTRLPGDLPGISFDIVREFADHGPGSAFPLPDIDTITVRSWPGFTPPSGAFYGEIYDASIIWIRRRNIIGPVTSLVYRDNEADWYTLPSSTPAPSTLPAFLASPLSGPPEAVGTDYIEEVFHTAAAGGTILLAGSGLIPALVSTGAGLPARSGYNIYYGAASPGDSPFVASAYSTATTAADFIASQQSPGDAPGHIGTAEVLEIYSLDLAEWLLP